MHPIQRESVVLALLEQHDILTLSICLVDASTLSNIARFYNEKEHSNYGKCCKGAHQKMLIRNDAALNPHCIPYWPGKVRNLVTHMGHITSTKLRLLCVG
jgi:hypothetical protein